MRISSYVSLTATSTGGAEKSIVLTAVDMEGFKKLKIDSEETKIIFIIEVNSSAYMHTCMHTYMHTCIHAYVRVCIRTYLKHACLPQSVCKLDMGPSLARAHALARSPHPSPALLSLFSSLCARSRSLSRARFLTCSLSLAPSRSSALALPCSRFTSRCLLHALANTNSGGS